MGEFGSFYDLKAKSIYLDYVATTPMAEEVRAEVCKFYEKGGVMGNPAGAHGWALESRDVLDRAREQVYQFLGGEGSGELEVIFTSGGVESNHLGVKGFCLAEVNHGKGKHVVASQVEHPSVLAALKWLEGQGFAVTLVGVDGCGRVDLDELKDVLSSRSDTCLVCTHLSHYDLGTVQNVKAVAELCHRWGVRVFCDALYGGGWVMSDVYELGVDLMSLSPHRFYGPAGVGILYCREGVELEPLLGGGRQEGGRRSGMENVAAISGAGVACALAKRDMESRVQWTRERSCQLWDGLSKLPRISLLGAEIGAGRDPHHLSVGIEGIEGEGLMLLLDVKRVGVTSRSACLGRNERISGVAKAIGLNESLAKGTVLLSVGEETTEDEIDEAVSRVVSAVEKLRGMSLSWQESQKG